MNEAYFSCAIQGDFSKFTRVLMAVVQVAGGISLVVGSGVEVVLTGGTATPLAVMQATVGLDMAMAGSEDLYNLTLGDATRYGQDSPIGRSLRGIATLSTKTFTDDEELIKAISNATGNAKVSYDTEKKQKSIIIQLQVKMYQHQEWKKKYVI